MFSLLLIMAAQFAAEKAQQGRVRQVQYLHGDPHMPCS